MITAVQKALRITPEEAERIAADRYGLALTAESLPSERDQNFLLRDASLKAGPDSAEQFVLKIAHAEEDFEFLDLQNQLIRFLAASKVDLAFPRIVKSKT